MKALSLVAVILLVGCSGSPTAPTPPPFVPVTITPPVVTPPVATPNPLTELLRDPRFDRNFYRMFALDAYDSRGRIYPLARQTQAPKIYLRTIHANGRPIDQLTLDQTAAALENTAGRLTGVFGLAGMERGTGSRLGQPGWITVSWLDDPERQYCGRAGIAGDSIELYTNTPGCRCAGGPAIRLRTVKHELGHALGFYHTDSPRDLMQVPSTACDQDPSDREIFHARVAYAMPVGSLEP